MANSTKISEVLRRSGTDQPSRTADNLNPESVELHGFGMQQWMEFAYDFALKVNYFDEENQQADSSVWQNFFVEKRKLEDFIKEIETNPNGSLTPHLTLFVCFLKLLELSNSRINKLTKRHLDFYYREVLQIENIAAKEDQAYVIFELAKRVSNHLIEEGVALDGGKDALGNKRIYKVQDEIAVSKTSIAQLKNIYNEHNILSVPGDDDESRFYVKASPIANSSDGLGAELAEEDPTWYPFGYYSHKVTDIADTLREELPEAADLPDAQFGFAIASPILVLNEGERIITVEITLKNTFSSAVTDADIQSAFEAQLTIHKKWLTSRELKSTSNLSTNSNGDMVLKLEVEITADEPAITGYDQELHGYRFNTQQPILRFLVTPNSESKYKVYKELASDNFIKQIDLSVQVNGIKTLSLESDTGSMNSDKPFYPFTTRPVLGSSFSFYNKEAFTKKWDNIEFSLNWKNTPASFKTHYAAYDSAFLGNVTATEFATKIKSIDWVVNNAETFFILGQTGQIQLTSGEMATYETAKADSTGGNPIVTSDSYFKVNPFLKYEENWIPLGTQNRTLFTRDTATGEFDLNFSFDRSVGQGTTGPIRLKLTKSFLHDMFPKIYALALSSVDKDLPLPNDPYSPFAEEVSMNYSASETIFLDTTSEKEFENRISQFYHDLPFGQSEVHAYLNTKHKEKTTNHTILPTYCKGGELYIGLAEAEKNELVTLFFQIAEGTENPLAETFIGDQKVKWEVLANNVWRELDGDLMVENDIDNFLRSGRIQFVLPSYATDNNTLLDGGLFWVRASMHKRYDAVAKIHGIHAQTTLVQFENNNNELSHLTNGLPEGTLTKLVERTSKIKSCEQPYGTFAGKAEESDLLYYRRVSERLRHKNRGITLWDYEHLVLQEFSGVYKAKCLNHTSENCFTAPGSVTLIVIPDTINKQVFDVYQPRVSQAKLNEIKTFLTPLISMHINLSVSNPNYEEVKIEVAAKFYKGLDNNLYSLKLKEDITRYLSPWAFEETRSVVFGITLHESALVHYMENLNYIDFIRDLRILKDGVLQTKVCMPSNPKSILVSAKDHKISLAMGCNEVETTDTTEICQL